MLDGLSDVFAYSFLSDIARVGNDFLGKFAISTARQYVKALHVYAEFQRTQPTSNIANLLKQGRRETDNRSEWLKDVLAFHSFLVKEYSRLHVVFHHVVGMNWWWERMSAVLICPAGIRLKNPKVKSKGVKTVFDFELDPETEAALIEVIGQNDNALELSNEAHRIYKHVCLTLGSPSKGVTTKNLSVLAQATLQKRMVELRVGLQKVFDGARRMRIEGLLKIRQGRQKHLGLVVEWLDWRKSPGAGRRNPWANHIYELSNDDFLKAHLAWCMYGHELKGLGPKSEFTNSRVYNLWRKELFRREMIFGSEDYQDFMGASRVLIISSYLMLIHDLTANPGSIASLPVSADYKLLCGISGVDWEKQRAAKVLTMLDGQAIEGLTPPSKIVRVVRSATRQYRKYCTPKDVEKLFLINYQNKTHAKSRNTGEPVNCPSSTWFNVHSQALIKEITGGEWLATALAVRASLLLLEGLKNGVLAAKHKAQHAEGRTTTGYLDKWPMKLQNEEKIRAFLEWLQALVAIDIEDFAEKVGLDPIEFEKRRQQVLSSQFGGLHCRDNTSGIQPGSVKGKPCTRIDQCVTCEQRSNLFVATEHNVLQLLLWNDALNRAHGNGWVDESMQGFLWAAFIDSMLARLRQNVRHKAVLSGALQLFGTVKENPYMKAFGKIRVNNVP